jgi:choline dehydrogenase-like flavoprotein
MLIGGIDMRHERHDVLVIGSGAGGATLARELTRGGQAVLVVEKGAYATKLGSFRHMLPFFDGNPVTRVPRKSKEGVTLWRTQMAGGSTVVSCGNGTRCLERELDDFGITLDREFAEAEEEMGLAPIDDRLLSDGARAITEAAHDLGYEMDPMPKFIDADRCKTCGQCVMGCSNDAKWNATRFLDEAIDGGADVVYETEVKRVLIEQGSAVGIQGSGPRGECVEYRAKTVVLSAGGLGSPVILQNSGIGDAGSQFFMDLLVNTYGVTDGVNLLREPPMAMVNHEFHADRGFILSPFANHNRLVRAMELGPRGMTLPTNRLLGMMVKTADSLTGQIFPDGTASKPVTGEDRARLDEGTAIATEILLKAGVDPKSIVTSGPQGGHPGGTAAIGQIVDENLQTSVDGLFVCDASVLPKAPGLPPILTIVALGKWLAGRLTV